MKTSITMLKTHLSRYVDIVKGGEEVIVTERGRPVARLVGLTTESEPSGRVRDLVREGRMRPPTQPPFRPAECDPVSADPQGRSLDALLEERREGR